MTSSELALLGGKPLRSTPFRLDPMIDEVEENAVLEAVRNINFSRYVGVQVDDAVLTMTSADTMSIDTPFHFLGGPNVRRFGADFAAKFQVPYAIPISSATSGLSVALAALGVGPGDEVIVPAVSFSATGSAPLMFNSIPVFVDVSPDTLCIDPACIEKAITPQTKAILVVHLAGHVADMDRILDIANRHGLKVVEDAAQAIGSTWHSHMAGTIGDAGVFSFQQSKNIMTGEGGMIVTKDPLVAKRCRLILNHGELVFDEESTDDDLANVVGMNLRMPELCAAVGWAQLQKLDTVNAWRNRNAIALRAALQGIPGLNPVKSQSETDPRAVEVTHFLPVLYDAKVTGILRAVFVAALRAEGIPLGTGYSRPMYEAPTFLRKIAYGREGAPWTDPSYKGSVSYRKGQCPVAEELLRERFLWFYHVAYPSTEEDMATIGRAVRKVLAHCDELAAAAPRLASGLSGYSHGRMGFAAKVTAGARS